MMTGSGMQRDNLTPVPGAAGTVPLRNPIGTQPNPDDENEGSDCQEENAQLHDLTFSGDMEEFADVLQN